MKCPHCPDVTLLMNERQGVEIDYCPQCRGVWLDRGELDTLIERSASAAAPQAVASQAVASQQRPAQSDFVDSDFRHHGRRKHKSWLSEIFD